MIMRFSAVALVISLVNASVTEGGNYAVSEASSENDTKDQSRLIPGSYIIEFAPGSAQRRDGIGATEGITVVKTFDSIVFSGASIETNRYNQDSLQSLPNVIRVWPNLVAQLLPTETTSSVAGSVSDQGYSTHNATGVAKLHAQGIFGKGAKVGIVDTGVWYTHPDLGGGFGPGFKVAGGYDFAGNGLWPYSGEKEPDDDPLDQTGHGTHVAGIVAGKGSGWSGVAPEANLYSYKIFTQDSFTDTATILEAFLRAFDDGVDIITASVGSNYGWSTDVWAEIASRFVEEGVFVTVASGNVGTIGPFVSSRGATGKNVIAVASVDSQTFPGFPFNAKFTGDQGIADETARYGYIPSIDPFPATLVDVPIVPFSLDTNASADACAPLEEGSRNFTGQVVLVRRGVATQCDFDTQQNNLAPLGGTMVLIYNNDQPLRYPLVGYTNSTVALISAYSGTQIVEAVKAGRNVTADFSVDAGQPVGLAYSLGGDPNYFTNIGPLYDLQIKPDIAAPGGKIYSTWLDNSYAIESGTSMATPYVAGVAALYVGVYGGRGTHPSANAWAKDLGKRIISSGIGLPWADGLTEKDYGHSASVAQIGNGLIDASKVLLYKTTIDFEKFALNDTHHFSRYHDIKITNNGEDATTYNFSVQDAVGAEVLGWYAADQVLLNSAPRTKRIREFFDMVPQTLVPDIKFPKPFTLEPGQSKTVTVSFGNPETLGWNSTGLPLYSGRITVSSSNQEYLSVPYLGIAGNIQSELSPMEETNYAFAVSTINNVLVQNKPYFTFNLSLDAQDFPKIISKPIYGTAEVRFDVFEADWKEREWKYPPVPGQNGYIGPVASWVGSGQVSRINTDYYDPNDTFTYPIYYINRNGAYEQDQHWWFGKLGNGSQIAVGNYTLRFALLKPFGNPTHSDNWEILKLPQISVLGQY